MAVLAFDRVHSFDLAMPLQVFTTAHSPDKPRGAMFGPQLYEVMVCGDGRDLMITGVDNVELYSFTPSRRLADALTADTIVVIGRPHAAIPPESVLDLLREAHRRRIRIASISAGGAWVMAATGLLDGRRLATHWSRADDLAAQFPQVQVDTDVLYIDHGDILTSAGAASGIDLCLHMIRKDFGAAAAADTARHMVVPAQRDGGQKPYIIHPEPDDDRGLLEPTLRWLRERLDRPVTLAEIAQRIGTSPRTANRLFKEQTGTTPVQWLLRQRVGHAQELLETTDLPIEEIAVHCGFGTAISLRQHFARHTGTSPTAYRRSFRSREAQV